MPIAANIVQKAYVAFFNRPADVMGLDFWTKSSGTLESLLNTFAGSAEYTNQYTGMNSVQIVNQIYQNLFARDAEPAGLLSWAGKLDRKELTLGNIASSIADGAQNTDATSVANKISAATTYTASLNTTAKILAYASSSTASMAAVKSWLKGVTTDATLTSSITTTALDTLNTSTTASAVATGSTFTLTTGADLITTTSVTAANKTTAGDDTIYATTLNSLNNGDVLSAGDGVDSLIADLDIPAANATTTSAPTISSVENITIRNTGVTADGGETFVFNAINSSGILSLTFDRIVGVTAASTFSATNNSSVSTAMGITNNATLAHNYTFNFSDTALAGAANTVTLNLSGNTTATGTVSIGSTSGAGTSGAETVNIVTTGSGASASSTLGSLAVVAGDGTTANNTAKMTTLTVSGTSALTITGQLDFAGTTGGTINATGMSAALSLTDTTGDEPIVFNAAGASGAMTVVTAGGNDKLTGGSGDDTFTIGSGFDTVVAGAGNDRVVITAGTAITANDSIALGDGSRDVLAIGTSTSLATLVDATYKALLAATTSGVEVIELTAADITAVDFSAITQDIVYLSGANAAGSNSNLTISNVATGDVLRRTADASDTTGAATISASGALPGQTFALELFGTGVDITATNTAATDHAIALTSGITTLAIDSSKSATDTATTANTIGGALHAGANAILNTSASNITITGNHTLSILNSTTPGVTFGAAVNINASAFTGTTLTLGGSSSADVITGGSGNDVITAGGGADQISLASGGVDKLNFSVVGTNGKDTITGFGSTDTLNVVLLGDGSTAVLTAVISSAAAQGAATDDSAYIINTTGAAANLTTLGTAAVTDWTNLTQVAAYLAERFTTATTSENVFVVNVTGTTTSYVYDYDDAATAGIVAGELVLVAVVTRDVALDTANIVFA